jgi:hypothetical protein
MEALSVREADPAGSTGRFADFRGCPDTPTNTDILIGFVRVVGSGLVREHRPDMSGV